jgi:methylated-DNA-[protein]-cysteine S-methyltransferase
MKRSAITRPTARYAVADTAVGPLVVAARDGRPLAVRFGFDASRLPDEIAHLHDDLGGRFALVEDAKALRPLMRDVAAIVAGRKHASTLEPDLSWLTHFQREVLMETARIPRCQVLTYAQVAERVGHPRAFRAVGNTLRMNPLPVLIPCHRVVASNGIGGFGGNIEMKRRLLALEGVTIA